MEYYDRHCFDAYNGKKIKPDIESLIESYDYDEIEIYVDEEDDGTLSGDGYVKFDSRDYFEEDPYEDEEVDEESEESEWDLVPGLCFDIENGCITNIEMTADVYGDDGLGDVNPEEMWLIREYETAIEFLKKITIQE